MIFRPVPALNNLPEARPEHLHHVLNFVYRGEVQVRASRHVADLKDFSSGSGIKKKPH
jgi:hypothetical protein